MKYISSEKSRRAFQKCRTVLANNSRRRWPPPADAARRCGPLPARGLRPACPPRHTRARAPARRPPCCPALLHLCPPLTPTCSATQAWQQTSRSCTRPASERRAEPERALSRCPSSSASATPRTRRTRCSTCPRTKGGASTRTSSDKPRFLPCALPLRVCVRAQVQIARSRQRACSPSTRARSTQPT